MRIKLTIAALIASTSLCLAATQDKLASFYRPDTIPFPENAPYNPEVATLGKMLFFDPRVSGAQNMSCASCHNPSFGWEAPVDLFIGAQNTPLGRHTPSILNGAWSPHFFWDGRARTLEEQAAGPIQADVEMNARFEDVIARLGEVEEYRHWFNLLFPDEGINANTILTSIATYERLVVSGWAPFDRWVEGDETAISDDAKRGFELFVGKARCSECHSGWNFTDNDFHDIGIATEDEGRAALVPDDPQARFAFKTPGLRNIGLRAPFMHAGQFADLEDVLVHYATGGIDRPSRSPLMASFELSTQDINDLVAFLLTLTEERTEVATPILPAN